MVNQPVRRGLMAGQPGTPLGKKKDWWKSEEAKNHKEAFPRLRILEPTVEKKA